MKTKWCALWCTLLLFATGLRAQDPSRFFKAADLNMVGAYYYPEHWDPSQWDRDLRKMSEMGFEITHFAEFAWAQLEPEEGRYDFEWLDQAVATAAKY
ncbi:MAG: beta-galactosidase, partial [Bacteroidales bacterium]|nr:beta-galactosidase [Bacteroidales bacterium]